MEITDLNMETTDFLVDVGNPAALDRTLQDLPGVRSFVIGGPDGPFLQEDGHYIVRVFGGDTANSIFEFMMKNQRILYCCGTIARKTSIIIEILLSRRSYERVSQDRCEVGSPRCRVCGSRNPRRSGPESVQVLQVRTLEGESNRGFPFCLRRKYG